MKRLELSSAVRSLADYAADLGDEVLVLTRRRRPVAAVVPLRNVDWESVALSYHPKFLEIIAKARADFAAGRTLSLEEVKRAVLPKRSSRRRTPRRARGTR